MMTLAYRSIVVVLVHGFLLLMCRWWEWGQSWCQETAGLG